MLESPPAAKLEEMPPSDKDDEGGVNANRSSNREIIMATPSRLRKPRLVEGERLPSMVLLLLWRLLLLLLWELLV